MMNVAVPCSDVELVNKIKANDKAVFDYLYGNYAAVLMYTINKIVNDSQIAEDLLQEVFVSIWTKIDQYDACKSGLYTWMNTIARNKAIDFMRGSAQNMRKRTVDLDASGANVSHTNMEQKTDKLGLNNLVTQLPNDHKQLICLAYYSGHTIKEIAAHLCIPMGTVKTRLRSAIGLLRKEFATPATT